MAYLHQFVVVADAAVEPVTPQEVKAWLRVDWNTDDDFIAGRITSAREWVELGIRRALITQTLQATLSIEADDVPKISGTVGFVGYPLDLPHATPLQSVSLVEIETQVGNWVTVGTNYYALEVNHTPGQVYMSVGAFSLWAPSLSYPSPPGEMPKFRITYVAGMGATATSVPRYIRDRIAQAAAWAYDNRSDDYPEKLLPTRYKVMSL